MGFSGRLPLAATFVGPLAVALALVFVHFAEARHRPPLHAPGVGTVLSPTSRRG